MLSSEFSEPSCPTPSVHRRQPHAGSRARTGSGSRWEEVFARLREVLPGRRAPESYNIKYWKQKFANHHCADILKNYPKMRPPLEIDGKQHLFYMNYKNKWCRMEVSRMFRLFKLKVQIDKPGGAHVFARHKSASLMAKNCSDLLTIKEVRRNKSIESTMRYFHLAESTKRS